MNKLRLGLGLLAFAVAAVPASARVVEGIAAVVEGEPITLTEVEQFARRLAAVSDPAAPRPEDRKELLGFLIDEFLIEKEAGKLGISISETEVDQAVDNILRANRLAPADLEKILQAQGISESEYRREIRRELLREHLVAREIQPRIFLSEEKIRTFYLENGPRFSSPPEIRLSQIFIAGGNPRAGEIVAKVSRLLEQRKDFAALAREFSEDASAARGGDIGFFALPELRPELREGLGDLPPGKPSRPVHTEDGWHFLLITEEREGAVVPYEKIKNQVAEELYAREVERGFRNWLEGVKARARIEIKEGPPP